MFHGVDGDENTCKDSNDGLFSNTCIVVLRVMMTMGVVCLVYVCMWSEDERDVVPGQFSSLMQRIHINVYLVDQERHKLKTASGSDTTDHRSGFLYDVTKHTKRFD